MLPGPSDGGHRACSAAEGLVGAGQEGEVEVQVVGPMVGRPRAKLRGRAPAVREGEVGAEVAGFPVFRPRPIQCGQAPTVGAR